ncbi:MAG: tryptophan synthase subunit beta, partial [Nitrospira sp.]|nr:tryptophan synthase subunit beta [Nitrospira sp.]
YKEADRIDYTYITDKEALNAFSLLSEIEGIVPALESAHAVAHVMKLAPTLPKDKVIIMNLSGRGDKDVQHVAELIGTGR